MEVENDDGQLVVCNQASLLDEVEESCACEQEYAQSRY